MPQVTAIPISLGGTGETNLADAQAALGITPGTSYANVTADSDGISQIENTGSLGVDIDATGADFGGGGTGPINLTSAGGLQLADESASAIFILEMGASDINIGSSGGGGLILNSTGGGTAGILIRDDSSFGLNIEQTGVGGITIDATGAAVGGSGTGPINLTSAGTIVLDDSALSSGSKLDLDATTPGVVTVSTILNAVGGLQVAGVALNNLVGTTAAIGGSALTLGQQATATVVIAGASAAVAAGAIIQATPTADIGDGFVWTASLTDADTITVKVLCLVAGTPTSCTYNVKVL